MAGSDDRPPVDPTGETETDCSGRRRVSRAGSAGASPPPRRFGRYEIGSTLGVGGMGRVWKAWDPELRRTVALKQIRDPDSQPEQGERFLREARAAARLAHPGIVAILDIGIEDGVRFFTTEYVDGGTLSDLVGRPMDARRAAEIVKAVAEALHHAHGQGVVHRDVKPANVLLDQQGRPRLTDFGLSRIDDPEERRITRSGVAMGTPYYMSPEQARGETSRLGPASDQFSLGVVLYELLAGTVPFEREDAASLQRAIIEEDPVPPRKILPRIDRDLETICLEMLEKDPEARYADLAAVAADLGRWLEDEPVRARRRSFVSRWARWLLRRAPLLAGAALVVAAAGVAAWSLERARTSESTVGRAEAEGERALSEAEARRGALDLVETGRLALDRARQSLYRYGAGSEASAAETGAARRLFEQALEKDPGLALAHYLIGQAWRVEGWDDRAEASWRRALELDPDLVLAQAALGRVLLERSFLVGIEGSSRDRKAPRPGAERLAEEGSTWIARALLRPDLWDDESERVLARALLAWARKDYGTVADLVREHSKRLGRLPGSEDYYWLHGLVAPEDEKLGFFDTAIEIRPTHHLALFCRGWHHQRSGEFDRAARDYTLALRVHPRFPHALVNRGILHMDLGDAEHALEDFTAALLIDPGMAIAHLQRGMALHALHDLPGALAASDEAIRIDPAFAAAYANRAAVRAAMDDREAARADYDEALRIDPEAPAVLVNRAFLLLLGDPAAARADCDEALRIDPDFAPGHVYRGLAFLVGGDLPSALRDLDQAIRLDPRSPDARAYRAGLLFDLGRFDEAIADAELALETAPPSWPLLEAARDVVTRARAAKGGGK